MVPAYSTVVCLPGTGFLTWEATLFPLKNISTVDAVTRASTPCCLNRYGTLH
ncbi:MAG: hypothetical protein PHT96_06370 [Syntrophorhabdaceae bacterium]|nr:hypothetical protein [Syntrophorhabdaceae bacterium]MDD4196020.1 hypothetical protein [Syntrophorhabdaceae bacterium]